MENHNPLRTFKQLPVMSYDPFREQSKRTAERGQKWEAEETQELGRLVAANATVDELIDFAHRRSRRFPAVLTQKKRIATILSGGRLGSDPGRDRKLREELKELLEQNG